MKLTSLLTMGSFFVALLAVAPTALALSLAQSKQVKHLALSVPLPEMPAQAATIVAKADEQDRAEVAVLVVKTIVSKHNAAAPLVVAAIAKAAPEVAAVAAAAAVEVDRSQAIAIADAAGMAAPWASAEIAGLLTAAVPQQAGPLKAASFRGFASVSASAITFKTRRGPIRRGTDNISEDVKQSVAASLGLTLAQLEALADLMPMFIGQLGNSLFYVIPLPLQADGRISSDNIASLFSGPDGSLNVVEMERLATPKAAITPVAIRYGHPR